LYLDIINC